MAMSDKREYTLPVKVKMTGFDTKRYAVVSADTTMVLQVESTGFRALLLSLKKESMTFVLDVKNEAVRRYSRERDPVVDLYRVAAVSDISTQLSDMLSFVGVRYLGSTKDSISIVLNERRSKTFHPDLSNLKINYSDGYGLYGEPMVSPAEVTLYGSSEVLDAIDKVGVCPVVLNNVCETGNYQVSIDSCWKTLGDIYSSTNSLTINIPVKRYVERQYVVPVMVADADSSRDLHLYPDHVKLRVWVVQEDVSTVSADNFRVSVDYREILSGASKLKLRVNRFPRNVRVRKVDPEEIEYVIIK